LNERFVRLGMRNHFLNSRLLSNNNGSKLNKLGKLLSKLSKPSNDNNGSENKENKKNSFAHYVSLLNLSIRERERENKHQVYANSVRIIGLRSVARHLRMMEHLNMNVFMEVHFRDGD